MSKQEFDSLFYHYLVEQDMSPTRAYETVVQTRSFLDTKPSWVILQHDGSSDEHV
jgi:hypothetical protein